MTHLPPGSSETSREGGAGVAHAPRAVFLDFEASSLGKHGWPVEVAWVFDNGEAESFLIRPAPGWTDWADSAERIHGISRAQLQAEGVPHDIVARRMMDGLSGHALYATAPSWDGKWLSVLLRGAGLPRHALRLDDTTLAHRRLVREVMAHAGTADHDRKAMLEAVLAMAARQARPTAPPVHRALADARAEYDLWQLIGRLARENVIQATPS